MSPSSLFSDRRGFTLAELMISLVLGALIIGAVLQFVTGTTRVSAMQSGREEVQQNARGALEMMASDLRGAIASGVEIGGDDEIQLLLPRRWGVVCGQTGTTRTVVAFPDIPAQPTPVGADAGLLFQVGNAWLPALPTRATVTASAAVVANTACATRSISGSVVALQLDGADHPAAPAGTTVALYQRVRYEVQDDARGDPWIHRSNGLTAAGAFNMQPLAGPVDEAAGGVSFTYFAGTPPAPLAAAPDGNASTANLSQVRLRVRMKSRQGSTPQVEFDSATVQIRNDNN